MDTKICRFVTFNCKNVKRSIENIRKLCKTSDMIALQESWLYPDEISFLNEIDGNFSCTGTSAVDTTAGVLRGRPHGGVALLWRNSVFQNVSVIQCGNPRLCAIKLMCSDRPIMVFSVYMPTYANDNLPDFTDCLGTVSAIIDNDDVESVYIMGDFNAHPKERFYCELSNFCKEQQWNCVDTERLGLESNNYTFISEAHGTTSWLDHCLVTNSALSSIINVYIKYDVNWSDHFPLVFECNLNLIQQKLSNNKPIINNNILWGNRTPEQIKLYYNECNNKLKLIDFPNEFLSCADRFCCNLNHISVIGCMYNDIVSALCESAKATREITKHRKYKYVAGWNKHVAEAHREARLKFQVWVLYSKPTSGFVYTEMCTSRKLFKTRLRWCQNHKDQLNMDKIVAHHSANDFRGFWKSTNKINSKPGIPVSVEGINDHKEIADLFKEHFAIKSHLGKSQEEHGTGICEREFVIRFTAKDVSKAIIKISKGKSPGHDGLSIEHILHAGPHINRILAMFYSFCIAHSYLPIDLMKTVIVPIVKNKTGDLSNKNNYRPISLATIIAKVFDGLLNTQLDNVIQLHDNQFGFRARLSTESAILSLKQTIRYYTDRKTSVYACFLDLSKAFDLVSYDILWKKLEEVNLPPELLNVLRYWYKNQINYVKWAGTISDQYRLECGVRQGGLTSPILFNLYINALIEELSGMHVGCHIDNICVNNISYADDMVLLSASVCGLRKLLATCEAYTQRHGLVYNVTKSEYIIFESKSGRTLDVPPINLNSEPLKRVYTFKYLGHLVASDLKDDVDIERERRALSVRVNMITRRFARCSREVKITLFRAYCTSLYTSSLWACYTKRTYSALRVQFNNAFRILLGLPRYCSASSMFAEAHVDCFYATIRKRCASLLHRVRSSPNRLMNMIADRYDFMYLNHCRSVCM